MTDTQAPLIHNVNWNIDYRVKLGRAWTRFLRGLENKQLLASKCDECERVFVPAQDYCEHCYAKIEEWQEVEPIGTLDTATIVYQGFEGGPEAPYAVGAIAIDGTDTLLMHFIGGVDLENMDEARARVKKGLRVRAVWKDERSGEITDILHFEPIE